MLSGPIVLSEDFGTLMFVEASIAAVKQEALKQAPATITSWSIQNSDLLGFLGDHTAV